MMDTCCSVFSNTERLDSLTTGQDKGRYAETQQGLCYSINNISKFNNVKEMFRENEALRSFFIDDFQQLEQLKEVILKLKDMTEKLSSIDTPLVQDREKRQVSPFQLGSFQASIPELLLPDFASLGGNGGINGLVDLNSGLGLPYFAISNLNNFPYLSNQNFQFPPSINSKFTGLNYLNGGERAIPSPLHNFQTFPQPSSQNLQAFMPQIPQNPLQLIPTKKDILLEQVSKELEKVEAEFSTEQKKVKEVYDSIPGIGSPKKPSVLQNVNNDRQSSKIIKGSIKTPHRTPQDEDLDYSVFVSMAYSPLMQKTISLRDKESSELPTLIPLSSLAALSQKTIRNGIFSKNGAEASKTAVNKVNKMSSDRLESKVNNDNLNGRPESDNISKDISNGILNHSKITGKVKNTIHNTTFIRKTGLLSSEDKDIRESSIKYDSKESTKKRSSELDAVKDFDESVQHSKYSKPKFMLPLLSDKNINLKNSYRKVTGLGHKFSKPKFLIPNFRINKTLTFHKHN